jgi:hypothetical protein
MPSGDALPLLYVAGAGRSGSTLLEELFCQRAGYFGVGELVYIWQRGITLNERCSCGLAFHDCPFWNDVLNDSFGGIAQAPVERILASQAYVLRMRNIPLLRAPKTQPPVFRGHVAFLHEQYSRLYTAIRRRANAAVVVDSTKFASYGHLLAINPQFDVRVVHLVRDSRAVAHSWQRRVRRPQANELNQYMPVYPVRTSAKIWMQDNIFAGGLRRHVTHGKLLRYEDLVRDPTVVELLSGLGLPAGDVRPLDGSNGHSVSGNPVRMAARKSPVRMDTAWAKEMSPSALAVVTALTAPGLLRYHYRLWPRNLEH